ncbi:TIGR00730 family Rossman fold protein [Sorangium sp. So ce185]|uniref:LOG family protein n=1 Tax=Sorangium sp. So ce185 TaxID=3133287 RepID=UPI003F6216D9
MRKLSRICVYCGSSAGASPAYRAAAVQVGELLAARGIGLVYGGGHVGLMGAVADAVLAAGGEAIGVIPHFLNQREIEHRGLTELHVVETMHERKAKMAALSDAFIALPGGIGTLEELFEVWTWTQLGSQEKPVGLLDVAGYYRPLIAFLDHVVAERFLKPGHRAMLQVESDAEALLGLLAAWRPTVEYKWMAPDER